MKKKIYIPAILILTLLSGSFFVINSNSTTGKDKEAPCTESMEICCSKDQPKKNSSGDMLWENISRQFIFTSYEILK